MAFAQYAKQALELLKQGPVQCVVDAAGGSEVEVFVRGGVTVDFERGQENAESDLVGVYDIFTTGDGATFELALEEDSVNALNVIFMECLQAAAYVGIGQAAGVSLRASALPVRFRPWQTRTLTTTQLDLWLCVPEGNASKSMTPDAPWRYTQTFRALPDLTKSNGELIGNLRAAARS